MKSATMISWELDPFRTRGGTAYAIRRLADQLTNLGVETTVLLPDGPDTHVVDSVQPLLKTAFVKMPRGISLASRGVQCYEFCRSAIEVLAQDHTESDVVIAHSLEGAMSIVMRSVKRSRSASVFWLHSLYDPPLEGLSREELPLRTLLASAVMTADIVVTSRGILKDAREFGWPEPLRELQNVINAASREGRVLTVESTGCLPNRSTETQKKRLTKLKPYVLFPGRPSADKGLGIFAAIAERLRADNITCVAVKRPMQAQSANPHLSAPIHWLPWLTQDELAVAIQNAACTVLPSVTEGFGLTAAESIDLGATTLFHEVGGHHALSKLPNALPVSLTSTERSLLYSLWSDLFCCADYWSVWARYEKLFVPLIDRWVETIRSVVYGEAAIDCRSLNWNKEEQWGSKLLQLIGEGRSPMLKGSVHGEAQPRLTSGGEAVAKRFGQAR